MEPGDRALDDVAEDAQAGAVWLAPSGDHGPDAALPELAAVDVVVVAAVGQQSVRPPAGPADPARDGRDLVEEGQQLGDVIAVAAGQRYRERDALTIDDEVVLAARPCAVDRARSAFGPRRAARTCEESITARSQSSRSFDRSSFSSSWWSWSQTPASFQDARRRQQVMPEPKPSS
ncbi:hypothetical protein NI25_00060 [Streptomyces sp. CCM_MD2014]|nr:hypothetical protein NI25_00060 [Streptomyces sp. CCM_MD2014]